MIYLNYAASTPFSTSNLQTYINVSEQFYSLPIMNEESKELKEQAENLILDVIKYDKHNLYFTSGGTEANNLAIIGFAKKFQTQKHFITSIYEHSSVYESFKHLEELGHQVTYVKPNENGIITFDDIAKEIKDNTVMVSIMQVNNELGSFNDVNYIFSKLKKEYSKIITMSDVCQSFGKLELPQANVCDIITFTAHKIYGPKGIGAVVINNELKLQPTLYGGSGVRPGTQNLAAQVSFAKACKDIFENKEAHNKKVDIIREYFISKITNIDNISLNCKTRTNVCSISIESLMLAEPIKNQLYERGIEISTRSACSSRDKAISRSLSSINLEKEKINKTIRVSFSHLTTYEEIDKLIKELEEITNANNIN